MLKLLDPLNAPVFFKSFFRREVDNLQCRTRFAQCRRLPYLAEAPAPEKLFQAKSGNRFITNLEHSLPYVMRDDREAAIIAAKGSHVQLQP